MRRRDERKSVNLRIIAALVFFLMLVVLFIGGCARQTSSISEPKRPVNTVVLDRETELRLELDKSFENPDVHGQLGEFYHGQQRWAKAEYHYNIALGFKPSHRDTQAALVKMYMDSGNVTKSRNLADSYIRQVSASAKQSVRLGLSFGKHGMDDYMLRCYRQAMSVNPAYSESYKQMGYYYLAIGDKEKAKEYLIRSFELNRRQSDVAGDLGRLGVVVETPTATGSDRSSETPESPK